MVSFIRVLYADLIIPPLVHYYLIASLTCHYALASLSSHLEAEAELRPRPGGTGLVCLASTSDASSRGNIWGNRNMQKVFEKPNIKIPKDRI